MKYLLSFLSLTFLPGRIILPGWPGRQRSNSPWSISSYYEICQGFGPTPAHARTALKTVKKNPPGVKRGTFPELS
jgi:hypothetical protein